MTEEQKSRVRRLREEGYGYTRIATMLNLSENTIKSFCRRNGIGGVAVKMVAKSSDGNTRDCLGCGVPVEQIPGRKPKKFCSDKCRNRWWNSHLEQVNRKANYEFVCVHCKQTFIAYGNSSRKFCSHECYVADRFGGVHG